MADQDAAGLGAAIDDGREPEMEAATPPQQDGEEKKKKNKGGRPPGGGSWISRLMGSSERAIIKKRDEAGQLVLCGEYTQEDIGRSGTMDLFIKDFIVPQYGYGKYVVFALRPDGNKIEIGSSDVLVPKGINPNASDPAATFQAMTDAQIKMQEAAERRAREAKEEAQREFDNMMKLQAAAKGGSMDPMMLMLLLSSRQQPSSSGDGGMTASIQAMRDAFNAAIEQIRTQAANAAPPMLPPSMPEGPSVSDLITMISTMMNRESPIEKLLPTLIPLLPQFLKKEESGFGLKELIGALPIIAPLIKQMTGADAIADLKEELRALRDANNQPRGIMDTLQEFRALREVASEMNPPAPAGESFFQFARDLIQSLPETTDAIGDLMLKISASKGSNKTKRLPPKEEDDEEPEQEILRYPQGFAPYVTKIAESKDDGEYVGTTLKAFQFLGTDENWKKYLAGMLVRAKGGDKEEVLEFISMFLDGLRDGSLLDKDSCEKAKGAFKRNIDSVIAWAQGFGKKKAEAAAK
jgi:hypothetical protein